MHLVPRFIAFVLTFLSFSSLACAHPSGPDARYTVAVMDDLNGEVDFDTGQEIVSQIVATLFAGGF